eukprot:1144784-Pelagomonas_calceolata.AAC.1
MQLGVGGGTKAGVNCWKALRDVRVDHKDDIISRHPTIKEKEKSTPAKRPRALRKGYLTSKLER